MAYIRKLSNERFRADVRMKGIIMKTFTSESFVQSWADRIEHSIKAIPNRDQAQLLALSDCEVCDEYLSRWNSQIQRVDCGARCSVCAP